MSLREVVLDMYMYVLTRTYVLVKTRWLFCQLTAHMWILFRPLEGSLLSKLNPAAVHQNGNELNSVCQIL